MEGSTREFQTGLTRHDSSIHGDKGGEEREEIREEIEEIRGTEGIKHVGFIPRVVAVDLVVCRSLSK